MRFLRQTGLRYHGKAIAPGAQTEHRGGAGPVRDLLGGGHAPAAWILCHWSVVSQLCVLDERLGATVNLPTYSDGGNGRTRQILTVPSRLAEAIHSPSGLKATLSTQLVCPWRIRISLEVASSRWVTIFTVESVLPQARIR